MTLVRGQVEIEQGRAALADERPSEALAHFEEALLAAPAFLPARLGRLRALLDLGDLPGSLVEARRVVRLLASRADHERIPDIRGSVEETFPGAGIFVTAAEPVFLTP